MLPIFFRDLLCLILDIVVRAHWYLFAIIWHGTPSSNNVHVNVTNGALPAGVQHVNMYSSANDAYLSDLDFEFEI